MPSHKTKVLFVVSEFYQAGTQRSTYEIDRAIDKSRFSIEILCLLPLNHSERWADHYYEKHRELGTPVHFLHNVDITPQPTLSQRLGRILLRKPLPHEHQALRNFLDQYNSITFMGEYNFPILARWMTAAQLQKSFIHIFNSRFQKPDIYARYDKTAPYRFVSGFSDLEIPWELEGFNNYNHTWFTLLFNVDTTNIETHLGQETIPKIGIFTRLTHTKPLDPFIYAFHLLASRLPDVELHIYGSGDPETEGVMKYVRHLGLEKRVQFRGHQADIVQTALNDKLGLVWLHGYHGVPGGWAGFDICTTGIPQVFWNFGSATETVNERFPMYNNLPEFVDKSFALLQNPEEARRLGRQQFMYVNENHNIKNHIHILENLYSQAAPKTEPDVPTHV